MIGIMVSITMWASSYWWSIIRNQSIGWVTSIATLIVTHQYNVGTLLRYYNRNRHLYEAPLDAALISGWCTQSIVAIINRLVNQQTTLPDNTCLWTFQPHYSLFWSSICKEGNLPENTWLSMRLLVRPIALEADLVEVLAFSRCA